jgi:signal transduction histidine kinase
MDAILDRMPAGYLAFGDDGVIVATNATLCAILACPTESLVGKHLENILTVPGRIFYQTHVFPLLKMQGYVNEVYVSARCGAGEEVPLLINAVRRDMGGITLNECVVVAMRRRNEYEDEILKAKRAAETANAEKDRALEALEVAQTELLRKQEELRIRNCQLEEMQETLEQQVKERTARLERQTAELQSFNYSIAHDFRAPLRALVYTSRFLREEGAAQLTEEQAQLLDRQIYNANRLSRLVDDLLQYSRLSLQEVHPVPIDLTAIARAARDKVLADLGRDDVTFHIPAGIAAVGDASLIQVVLENLFDNAAKFSPGGGVVWFGEQDQGGERIYFVRDEGIGLDMSYAHKIFEPFQRLHHDDEYSGTGIGLALVERIVSRHDGRVWVESELGRGSTFFFSF